LRNRFFYSYTRWRYAQLTLQGAIMSCYPKDSQMNQHEQPLGPAIEYTGYVRPA